MDIAIISLGTTNLLKNEAIVVKKLLSKNIFTAKTMDTKAGIILTDNFKPSFTPSKNELYKLFFLIRAYTIIKRINMGSI